jgi:hypothetical protein
VEGEGFFGLYKGFYINFLSQSAAQALFFGMYENIDIDMRID